MGRGGWGSGDGMGLEGVGKVLRGRTGFAWVILQGMGLVQGGLTNRRVVVAAEMELIRQPIEVKLNERFRL